MLPGKRPLLCVANGRCPSSASPLQPARWLRQVRAVHTRRPWQRPRPLPVRAKSDLFHLPPDREHQAAGAGQRGRGAARGRAAFGGRQRVRSAAGGPCGTGAPCSLWASAPPPCAAHLPPRPPLPQFKPAPPLTIGSPAYIENLAEVFELGRKDSQNRTQEQTDAARFWADGNSAWGGGGAAEDALPLQVLVLPRRGCVSSPPERSAEPAPLPLLVLRPRSHLCRGGPLQPDRSGPTEPQRYRGRGGSALRGAERGAVGCFDCCVLGQVCQPLLEAHHRHHVRGRVAGLVAVHSSGGRARRVAEHSGGETGRHGGTLGPASHGAAAPPCPATCRFCACSQGDGSAETAAYMDKAWTPLLNTPSHPEHPSGEPAAKGWGGGHRGSHLPVVLAGALSIVSCCVPGRVRTRIEC